MKIVKALAEHNIMFFSDGECLSVFDDKDSCTMLFDKEHLLYQLEIGSNMLVFVDNVDVESDDGYRRINFYLHGVEIATTPVDFNGDEENDDEC